MVESRLNVGPTPGQDKAVEILELVLELFGCLREGDSDRLRPGSFDRMKIIVKFRVYLFPL